MISKTQSCQEVIDSLEKQIEAWNHQDLEKFMTYYWDDPEMLWVNKQGIQKGYQWVLELFLNDYSDRNKMGDNSYDLLYIEELSAENVLLVFKWQIELSGQRVMGAVSTQIWRRIMGRWVATAEHAS